MKVKDLLTENNWGKASPGCYLPPCSKICLGMAINDCYPSWEKDHERIWSIVKNKLKLKSSVAIVDWNDAPERTFAEVRQLIEELDI